MANNPMERGSLLLANWEMKIKVTMIYQLLTRMAKSKSMDNAKGLEQLKLSYFAGCDVKCYNLFGNQVGHFL